MVKMSDIDKWRGWSRALFLSAAVFNYGAGVGFLFAMPELASAIGIHPVPTNPFFSQLAAILVIVFGWGYWRTAKNPFGTREIVCMGIFGKSAVCLLGIYGWYRGYVNLYIALFVVTEAMFAILFVIFLGNGYSIKPDKQRVESLRLGVNAKPN